jgi:CBS domain-containing protein
MSVGEYCNRAVIVALKSASVLEIAQLMREYHVGSVIIVENDNDNNIPIGIITDRDVVIEVVAPQVDMGAITAGDIMSAELMTAREIDSMWETIRRMRARGVRRVPVVNEEGVLAGILSVDDILEAMSIELNDLIKIISKEQDREQATRTIP